jgi:kynurenine 3-monooxygenase
LESNVSHRSIDECRPDTAKSLSLELAQLAVSPLCPLLNTAGVFIYTRHAQVCHLLASGNMFALSRCQDIRLLSSKVGNQQRSINLAVSHRGIVALETIDPAATRRFMQAAVPMRGRMIHKLNGNLESQLYDRDGQVCIYFSLYTLLDLWSCRFRQCINSIDRGLLNEELLERVSASQNIHIYFSHKVVSADFDEKLITLRELDSNTEFSVAFDLCIGADGSHSIIRRQMMRVVR